MSLPRAHGHFDRVCFCAGRLDIEGWMLDPHDSLDSVEIYVEGELAGTAERRNRPDVALVFRRIAHAHLSGFHLETDFHGDVGERGHFRVEAIGFSEGRRAAMLSGLGKKDPSEFGPEPSGELIRMIGSPAPDAYRTQGLQVFGDILQAVSAVADYGSFRRVLDWGAGCGRIAVHFLEHDSGPEFFGCDVVPELVEWCSEHLPKGRFCRISPFPPTHFEEGFFDFVFSSSVMTHLNRDLQKGWLAEVRRILRPGGIFVASTLGESAFSRDFVYSRGFDLRSRFRSLIGLEEPRSLQEAGGILDNMGNRSLGAAVPGDYYRNVYQTPEYTKQVWSEVLPVIRYIERGLDHYQDLVLMIRPD